MINIANALNTNFNGRINRGEFCFRKLFEFGISFMLGVLFGALVHGNAKPDDFMYMIAVCWGAGLIYYSIVGLILRAHDIGHSGHICWLMLIPIVNIFLGFYLLFAAGKSS